VSRSRDIFLPGRAIGWECAGAVSVLPVGERPGPGAYLALSIDELLERLDALPRRPYDSEAALRMSLAGGQPKLVARFEGERWSLPLDGAPSTHTSSSPSRSGIRVLPRPRPGRSRWRAAAPTARANLLEAEGHLPALVVERYDRIVRADRSIERMHQEDGCQVLGVESAAKYAEPPARQHQPSFARLAQVLVREGRDPTAELAALLRVVTIHVAFADSDAHAKNISFLHDPERLMAVAPIYDLAPTEAFIEQRLLAMPVGGRFRMAEVGVEQLLAEARSWRLDAATARAVVATTIEALRAGVAAADARVPEVPGRVRDRAIAGIERLAASG
jgi:serine/threonine-protein kinase HipA